jgi:ABC-type branched-subunit amino acid transport system ATPase component/MFS family permease
MTATRERRGDEVVPDAFAAAAEETVPLGLPDVPSDEEKMPLRDWLRPKKFLEGWSSTPLLLLFALNLVDELDRTAFSTVLPEIKDDFGLSLTGVSTLVALVVPAAVLIGLPIAHYADRRRRTRFVCSMAVTWGVFSFLTGLAPVLLLLGMARVGSGLGRGVNEPLYNSLLPDYYPLRVRAKVFAFHRAANNLGQFAGPIIAGGLVGVLGLSWRVPFFLFAIPTFILVALCLKKLSEPVRGGHERRALGADEETVAIEEKPASFSESWRTLMGVKTLKRFYMSLPFFFASLIGLQQFLSLFYDEVFGLKAGARGVVLALDEPFAILGLVVGAPLLQRALNKRPALGMRLIGMAGLAIASLIALQAVSPTLWMAIPVGYLRAALGAILIPGVYAVLSLVIPPKARTLGFAAGGVFGLLGAPIIVIVGAIGDNYGLRVGILMLLPIYLIGSAILFSCASFIDNDIAKVRSASLAQAEARKARLEGDPKVLLVRDLDVSYGQTQVLFDVDFHVDEGEIVALLGTNGAGKSTLLNAISGLVEPTGGAIVYDGHDITMSDANTTVAEGIVFVPGGKGVFPTLTVEENLNLAGWLFAKDPDYLKQATEQVLEYFPVLHKRWNQKAGNLSGGEQQMLTLGQAFIAQPKLLMIDELSLGLAPVIVEQLLDIVRAIHANGTTIILVEQSVNVAMSLAKRAVFMEKGEVRFDGPTNELLERPDVLRAVFLQGTDAARGNGNGNGKAPAKVREKRAFQAHCEHCGTEHKMALETVEVSVSFGGINAVNGVDLSVHEGQILGLIGPNGAGKTTIFDLISGYLVPTGGRVLFGGQDITELAPEQRAMLGLGRSFQDARLFPSMTVRETIAVALERHIPTKDPVAAALMSPATKASEARIDEEVERLIELMHLEAFADKFIGELSTGSRRVVDLACSVAHDPKVLLLDEPSSGIAQRETEALGPLLLDMRDKTGAALIVIEHDMPLITGISDELIALDLGTVIARGQPEAVVSDPRVVESYLGGNDAVINRSGAGEAVPVLAGAAEAAVTSKRRRYGNGRKS